MAKISVPSGWSKQDIEGFLKFVKPDSEDKETRDSLKTSESAHHCWRNGGCAFWCRTGEEEYRGHCSLGSGDCATAVLNRRNPTRWLPR